MAVSIHVGLTESGKSRNVQKKVLPNFAKVIVFDNAKCFHEGEIFDDPSTEEWKKIWKTFRSKKDFKIIIRPSRTTNRENLCNKTIHLALALGRCILDGKTRLQLVIDEADFVCNSRYRSDEIQMLVGMGRHDNVDSHFIARSPIELHTSIRANVTHLTVFRLSNALEIPFLTNNLGRDLCRKIQTLPKYYRCEWDTTGKIEFFTDKNKKFQV